MMRDRIFLIPLVAVGLIVAAFYAPQPSDDPRRPAEVDLTQTSYACPAGAGIQVSAGQLEAGTSGTATVLPDEETDEALAGADSWRTSRVDGRGVIIEQQGRGSGPAGFFSATAPKDGGGGLIVGSCPGIVDDAWFVGLGSGAKHFSTLILTNIAAAPAAVDLELWGSKGKVDAIDAQGVVVEPFTTRRIQLDDLAAGEAELALRVHRRRGSVSAIVNDRSTAVFRGTEPIGATAAPRRAHVIGGLASGAAGRTLALLNPGDATARVEVEVIGSKSTFKPSDIEAIKVKAGALRLVTVPSSAGSGRQALRVTSDVPVAATVRMAPNNSDYAYAESVEPLEGPAILPVALGKGVGEPDLIVTAPGKVASVQLFAYDKDMELLGDTTMTIGAGTTQHIDTAKAFDQKGIAFYVVQAKNEVVAAATYRKGDGISSLALISAPIRALAPQVRAID